MHNLCDSDILWRYMDLDRFVNMIAFKDLFFNSASGYPDDPFENYCDIVPAVSQDANIEERFKYYAKKENYSIPENITIEEKKKWLAKLFCTIQDATVISCWHRNESQSAAMWNLYATNPKAAVAIRTDYSKLRKIFPQEQSFSIRPVSYIDYVNAPVPDAYDAIWYKRLAYKHENEVRVVKVTDNYGKTKWNPDGSAARTGGITHLFPANLNELIDFVYISPYAGLSFAETVASLMNQYDLKCPLIFQDQAFPGSGKLWRTPRELMKEYV